MPFVVPLVVFAGCAVVFGTTLAAARGRLGLNQLAGFRSAHVMASPEAWRVGHRAAFVPVAVGCALAVGSVVVPLVVGLPDVTVAFWAVGSMVVLMIGTLVGTWRADQAATDVLATS